MTQGLWCLHLRRNSYTTLIQSSETWLKPSRSTLSWSAKWPCIWLQNMSSPTQHTSTNVHLCMIYMRHSYSSMISASSIKSFQHQQLAIAIRQLFLLFQILHQQQAQAWFIEQVKSNCVSSELSYWRKDLE